jgi:cytochrome c-type biogenesis protein
MDVSIGMAALYGALSFLSPCVLPLVPPYLVFISGVSLEDMNAGAGNSRARVLLAACAFVLGFSTVFVLLGATASYLGQALRDHLPLLANIAGVFIIIMGLHFLGVFRIGFLNREMRYQTQSRPIGLFGAYAVGLAFAFGWTPCIGPILGTILSVAANQDTVSQGMFLLAVYSLGLGIPFLAAAFSAQAFLGFFKRFRVHLSKVEKVMGGLLVLTGVLFLTGFMQRFSFWLLETFPALGQIG